MDPRQDMLAFEGSMAGSLGIKSILASGIQRLNGIKP